MKLKYLLKETHTNDFLVELKQLLLKYDADIYVNNDSESTGESVEIAIDVKNQLIFKRYDSISGHDIKL